MTNITIPAIEDAIARAHASSPRPITAFALSSEDFAATLGAEHPPRTEVEIKPDDGCPRGSLCWATTPDDLWAETRINPKHDADALGPDAQYAAAKWWNHVEDPDFASTAHFDMKAGLDHAIERMKHHGPTTAGALKSRELSTAITYAETARLWLDKVPLPD